MTLSFWFIFVQARYHKLHKCIRKRAFYWLFSRVQMHALHICFYWLFFEHNSERAIDALKSCIGHRRWSKMVFMPCLSVLMESSSTNINIFFITHQLKYKIILKVVLSRGDRYSCCERVKWKMILWNVFWRRSVLIFTGTDKN